MPKQAKKTGEVVSGYRVEAVAIEDLRPYERNARVHSADQVDQIVASIVEFGWTNPILVDVGADHLIVAGHGRLMAAKKLYATDGAVIRLPDGREFPPGTVPIVDCTGWTEAQRRAYTLADNRLAENATWDEGLLKIEIGEIAADEAGFDLGILGFDAKELEKLTAGEPAVVAPDEFPEHDEAIATEHCCPKCGYRWSGKSS